MRPMAVSTSAVSALRLRRAYSSRNQRPRALALTVSQMVSKSPSAASGCGGIVDRAKGSSGMVQAFAYESGFAHEAGFAHEDVARAESACEEFTPAHWK